MREGRRQKTEGSYGDVRPGANIFRVSSLKSSRGLLPSVCLPRPVVYCLLPTAYYFCPAAVARSRRSTRRGRKPRGSSICGG